MDLMNKSEFITFMGERKGWTDGWPWKNA